MKTILPISIVTLILFSSCMGIEKTIKESYRHEMYIDYKMVSFQGRNSSQQIYMEIDSTKGIWYHGKIIVDSRDTLLIRGFGKGGHYPSWYQTGDDKVMVDVWCMVKSGQIPDSIEVGSKDKANGIILDRAILYRQPRINCR